jgi:uncharacterized protein (DUF1684 family)
MQRAPFFLLAFLLAAPAALGATPRQEWQAGIAEQNRAYTSTVHAMLKIQGSVYLGEGDSAVVVGRAGQAASWHWDSNPRANGALKVSYRGGKLSVTLNGRAIDARRIEKSVAVDTGVDVAGQPTQVGAGVNGWRLFLYNQQNPAARHFPGVKYFPYDPAFRVSARFVPDMKLPGRVFQTSRGTGKQFFHAVDAVFALKGRTMRLPFYAESRDAAHIADMSAFFTDALTGKGAYGAGRYVDAVGFGKFPPARITIDFNQAYNPNCALSPHFTCPLAVDALPLAVRAGERDPHAH